MILTADSGSTKTTWMLRNDNDTKQFVTTQGINPFHMAEETMRSIILTELIPSLSSSKERIEAIDFYGAGCTAEKSPTLQRILQECFPSANNVSVASDMLGAAKALFGSDTGIACILGTGANSCLYDGNGIISNVSPMGYILGDEGSGAVLGKTFVNMLYKGEHRDFIATFESETGLTAADIIQRVYREQMPNRFLASLCPFISKHIGVSWIEDMVIDCFRLFFRNNVKHYGRPDLPCSFVGSIAHYFAPQLRRAAKAEGFTIGRIQKEPLSED